MKKPRPWLIPFGALKPGPNRLDFELFIEELGGQEQEVAENPSFEELVGTIRVELEVFRTGRSFLVSGTVKFRARMLCAVCAREYERDFVEPLATDFVAEGEVPTPQGKVMDGKPVDRVEFKGDVLDLAPLVRDTIHLAVPIAPRCRDDCRGLCIRCGRNLNDGPCDCPPESDSPFAGLARLKDDAPGPGA